MKYINVRQALVVAGLTTVVTFGVAGCGGSNDTADSADASTNLGAAISDTAITAGVRANLAVESFYGDSDISVATSNGVVTLSGTVLNSQSKSVAERIAASGTGVKRVRNDLDASRGETAEAVAGEGSDTWITTQVKAELLADSESSAYDVSVETRQGWVELSGSLETRDDVDNARDIALAVEGVRGVDSSALQVSSSR